MASSQQQGIKVVSEWYVKPSSLLEAAKQPYYLGPLELAMLTIHPIQKGLLFPSSSSPAVGNQIKSSCLLEKLKSAVSQALVHFFPLAGQLSTQKYEDEHACCVFLEPTKGPGAKLVHASALHLSVSDILASIDVPLAVYSFFDLGEKLVNHDGHSKPLLSIQVTELLDGVFIGFSMNHSVLDGTTFIHFVGSLSEIFRSQPISRVPLFKPFFPDGYGPILKLPHLEPQEFIKRSAPGPGPGPGSLRERIFHFSAASMATLKAVANEECEAHNISSFQALSGLVWRSIIKASNPARDEGTSCNLLINARTRLNPPLSNDYFGNFLSGARVMCTVDELLGRGLGCAARVLHQSIVGCDEKMIYEILKFLADRHFVGEPRSGQIAMYGPNSVVIGGSARFDMYGPEFGLGRAVAVRTGYGNKDDGKVTANPGCEGGGSVDLEICLKPEVMAALEADEEFMRFVSLS